MATTLNRSERVTVGRIWRTGFEAILIAVIANVIVYFIGTALVSVPPEFLPLANVVPTIIFTIIGVLGAVIAFAIVARVSRQPIRTYRLIAGIALIISILPDFTLQSNPMFPGATPASIAILVLMHFVAASVAVYWLTTRTTKQ